MAKNPRMIVRTIAIFIFFLVLKSTLQLNETMIPMETKYVGLYRFPLKDSRHQFTQAYIFQYNFLINSLKGSCTTSLNTFDIFVFSLLHYI